MCVKENVSVKEDVFWEEMEAFTQMVDSGSLLSKTKYNLLGNRKNKGESMVKKIMIVDDDFVTRYILRDVLETGGHRVVAEASSGEEAVTKYRELTPDIVIMDIVLPNKNGLTAANEILAINSHAKIIVISVLDNTLLVKAAQKMGALDFIHKPFTPEKLLEVIQNLAAN